MNFKFWHILKEKSQNFSFPHFPLFQIIAHIQHVSVLPPGLLKPFSIWWGTQRQRPSGAGACSSGAPPIGRSPGCGQVALLVLRMGKSCLLLLGNQGRHCSRYLGLRDAQAPEGLGASSRGCGQAALVQRRMGRPAGSSWGLLTFRGGARAF